MSKAEFLICTLPPSNSSISVVQVPNCGVTSLSSLPLHIWSTIIADWLFQLAGAWRLVTPLLLSSPFQLPLALAGLLPHFSSSPPRGIPTQQQINYVSSWYSSAQETSIVPFSPRGNAQEAWLQLDSFIAMTACPTTFLSQLHFKNTGFLPVPWMLSRSPSVSLQQLSTFPRKFPSRYLGGPLLHLLQSFTQITSMVSFLSP